MRLTFTYFCSIAKNRDLTWIRHRHVRLNLLHVWAHNALDIFGVVDTLDIAAHSGSDGSPAPYDAGCDAVAASEIRVNRCVAISGCSGGGKSKLLAELGRRGYTVIESLAGGL
jgi:hypothetical protein